MVLLSDMGSSLMLYGGLLAMLYVATGRISFVLVGALAFALGAWFLGTHISMSTPGGGLAASLQPEAVRRRSGQLPIANGLFAQAAGGCSARASANR